MQNTTTHHRPSRPTTRRLAAGALIAALLLGACGGSGNSTSAGTSSSTAAGTESSATPTPAQQLNVNTATEAELRTIPGVGEKIADEIMEYRPYTSMSTFREELSKYIDDDEIARIEAYLTL